MNIYTVGHALNIIWRKFEVTTSGYLALSQSTLVLYYEGKEQKLVMYLKS